MSNYTVLYLNREGHVIIARHAIESVARDSARRNKGIMEDAAGNLVADYRLPVWGND